MTTIKATCPGCGEVALTPRDIELRVDQTGADDSYYAFTCPSCLALVRKPADERVVRLLVSGGVPAQPIEEAPELRPRFEGPAFTYDDLLDFHQLLEGGDWFDDLVATAAD
jgi:hypothetical protein